MVLGAMFQSTVENAALDVMIALWLCSPRVVRYPEDQFNSTTGVWMETQKMRRKMPSPEFEGETSPLCVYQ